MRTPLLAAVLILTGIAGAGTADGRTADLDGWVDGELIPGLIETLTSHPRFKSETLMFVVLANNAPAPVSNALALGIRDRILEAAIDASGVRIAWRQAPHASSGCRQDQADYLVGIELSQSLNGQHALTLRALDVAEGTWVNGFGKTWRGRLSARELAAWRATESDPAFLGTREVPYSAEQVDLIARHLSHELACDIYGAFQDDFVIALNAEDGADEPLALAVTLATRNLDQADALALTGDASAANAEIHGRAHAINGALHQYWLSITPTEVNDGLDSLSTSVYVSLPHETDPEPGETFADVPVTERPATATPVLPARVHGVEMPGSEYRALLQPLKVYRDRNCSDARNCSVLEARAADDVIVFTLVNTQGEGLKRLGDAACRARSAARVVTAGHTALFPVPGYANPVRSNALSGRWMISPADTTYYAIAIDNARDARRVAAIVDELPTECPGRYATGLNGLELEQWLERLSHLMLSLGRRAEWRALEVNPIY